MAYTQLVYVIGATIGAWIPVSGHGNDGMADPFDRLRANGWGRR